MPFITSDRRGFIAKEGLAGLIEIQPGDRCYVFYKAMVEKWKANPRWATAHEIYKNTATEWEESEDSAVAIRLAWEVFFQLYVIPYELKKREENGDI